MKDNQVKGKKYTVNSTQYTVRGIQYFNFLVKFSNPRDVKIVLENKRVWWWNVLWIAWQLWRGVPVAKIINKKWFYGLPFYTNRHTLDPRPDSETLVEAVLANEKNSARILDLGTGTGCLLCAILKNLPNATGVGIDKSRRALSVAKRNIRALGLSDRAVAVCGKFSMFSQKLRSNFCHPCEGMDRALNRNAKHCRYKNFKDPVPAFAGMTKKCKAFFCEKYFDIIISNPPYIAVGDVVDRGARHDPKTALYSGADGLKFYHEIAMIRSDAKLYLEIGAGQEKAVRKIFTDAAWRFISKHKDLSGRVRVLVFSR